MQDKFDIRGDLKAVHDLGAIEKLEGELIVGRRRRGFGPGGPEAQAIGGPFEWRDGYDPPIDFSGGAPCPRRTVAGGLPS